MCNAFLLDVELRLLLLPLLARQLLLARRFLTLLGALLALPAHLAIELPVVEQALRRTEKATRTSKPSNGSHGNGWYRWRVV